jgi:hypothetical protein
LTLQKSPRLKGRRKLDGIVHLIAETGHVYSQSVDYTGVAGGVTVDVYRAVDPKDIGVVLRIKSAGEVGFVAHAEVIEGGVELHLAGDQAERVLLDALLGALRGARMMDLLQVKPE